MGDLNLADALEKVASSTYKERNAGLEELDQILKYNRRSASIEEISHKAYHRLLETLFGAVVSEKAKYLKATSKITERSNSTRLLSSCASALRLAVRLRVRKLRTKTLTALLDHIVQTLPVADEGYCEPLSLDYVKSLSTILKYQPHVEHLPREDWKTIVDLCTEGIQQFIDSVENGTYVPSNVHSFARTLDASIPSTSRSGTQEPRNRNLRRGPSKAVVDELALCLRQLTHASNAPILDRSEPILSALTRHLQFVKGGGRAHQDVLATVNSVLSTTSLESVSVTQQAIRDLVPIISDLWVTKQALKDEMLITLTLCKANITKLVQSPGEESFKSNLEMLLEAMHGEYSKRLERDQLQIGDLVLRPRNTSVEKLTPLNATAFHLRTGNIRSEKESHWMVLSLIASLTTSLDADRAKRRSTLNEDSDETHHKRQRLPHHLHEYLRQLLHPHLSTRLSALQAVTFAVQNGPLEVADIQLVMDSLTTCVSDANGQISSWAMLGAASCAYQKLSCVSSLASSWVMVWQLMSRNMTTANTCRAACHAMDIILKLGLVQYASVAEHVDAMISSIELNGPAIFADSSSSLWATLLRLKASENPGIFNITSERILQWLFSKWTPRKFEERFYALYNSHIYDIHDVLRLLNACTDRPPSSMPNPPFRTLGPVAQASLYANNHSQLVNYLLLTETEYLPDVTDQSPVITATPSYARKTSSAADVLILDFFATETERALQRWTEWMNEQPQNISADMVRIVTMLCILCSIMSNQEVELYPRRSETLHTRSESFVEAVTAFVAHRECDQGRVDTILEVLAMCLPDFSQIGSLDRVRFKRVGVLSFILHLSSALEHRGRLKDSVHYEEDEVLINGEFESQPSQGRSGNEQFDPLRRNLTAFVDIASLRSSVAAYLRVVASAFETADSDSDTTVIPRKFVQYLISLAPNELLASRQLLASLLSSHLQLAPAAADDMLRYLGENLLENYDYERCEMAQGMCLDALSALAPLWTDPDLPTLYETGEELYRWFITVALTADISSSDVEMDVADLFHCLLKVRPGYGHTHSLASVRTSFFGVLQNGNILVKYHIAEHIPHVFRLFVPAKHDAIFDDVHNSLPKNKDWVEGLAIRLLVLARLASAWPTLLRRCVYHIFETAGMIEGLVGHAARCATHISDALQLPNPRTLFKLFAPQLLYTWLDSQPIEDIPYPVFGYNNLADLLHDVDDEALSQGVMRGKETEVTAALQHLGTTTDWTSPKIFSKAVAYTISWDTCMAGPNDKTSPGREAHLRGRYDKGIYATLIKQQLPRILGLFFLTMEHEDQIEKAFSKHPGFAYAAATLTKIRDISSSTTILPASQQPSFPAKYLLHQIERLCRRTGSDPVEIWLPGLFVYVMRMLLSSIHPALGPPHACLVLRKIRLLVGIAGNVATEGYPLEMTLHALRPFLTDHQCAADALGIVQYLFDQGRPYLQQSLSFLTGTSVLLLISVRGFLGASQESTTQESQYLTNLDKANAFHSWFTVYLESFRSVGTSSRASDPFLSLIHAACKVSDRPNAVDGTPESQLLLQLLDDGKSGQNLLTEQARDLIFNLLCGNFQPPPLHRVDILGPDHKAAAYCAEVWKSSHRTAVNSEYLLWCARVLGRTYSSRGGSQMRFGRAVRLNRTAKSEMKASATSTSRVMILQTLSELLLSDKRQEVGLAEDTLRAVVTLSATSDDKSAIDHILPASVITALSLSTSNPVHTVQPLKSRSVDNSARPVVQVAKVEWIQDLTISLAQSMADDPVLRPLTSILIGIDDLSEKLFPYVLHLVLTRERYAHQQSARQTMSEACHYWFQRSDEAAPPYASVLITAILYLRKQTVPGEATQADRDHWLEVNFIEAARAAARCRMYQTALLFAEIYISQPMRSSRRSSIQAHRSLPADLLLSIYKSLDEPDSFYGVQQSPSLGSVLDRLDYEADGFKSLLFRGARLDSEMRRLDDIDAENSRGAMKSLSILNLNSLTHSLLSDSHYRNLGGEVIDTTLHAARKLERWDIKAPESRVTEASTLYRAFQGIHNAASAVAVRQCLDNGLLETINAMTHTDSRSQALPSYLRTLAVLTEIDEVMSSTSSDELYEIWGNLQARQQWMHGGRMEDFRSILSSRETLLSVLISSPKLQDMLHVSPRDVRSLEVQALLTSSSLSRKHGALEESLAAATYLSDLAPTCLEAGLNIGAAAQYEVASVLWDHGETSTSIRMLQQLDANFNLQEQASAVARSTLLAKLGHQIAEARLEKPEEIMRNYLHPAIKNLNNQKQGSEAGQVHHEFAIFCDKQLQNSDSLEDFDRMQKLVDRRAAEIQAYTDLARAARNKQEKDNYTHQLRKVKKWHDLDNHEYQRLRASREAFLRQSLENYLLTLHACNEHDGDVLRFFSLWLEYAETAIANTATHKHLSYVPSAKFVALMNQLSSRLQSDKSDFQKLLSDLVFRICVDHPYHGMHHIFSGISSLGVKDEKAKSRYAAAKEIASRFKTDKRAGRYWSSILHSNNCYQDLAMAKDQGEFVTNHEYLLDDHPVSKKMMQQVPSYRVPPATAILELRSDRDYSGVPRVAGFKPKMRIANGLSCPKILTAIGSDGRPYKQLFKGGTDDLRQDAIMEQVFEQASTLLRNHTSTRQRNLYIRTYKVLPLSAVSGIMEFVQNTIALHDYLMPAHERYYPKDIKPSACRKKIHEAAGESQETRVKTFKAVIERFTPVMRYFFVERFPDPEEWFEKRLAYTRSTAAISILGHVLGLGDRHCHNILLDEKSGEVVHIDLGIAFEAGRVLPVPEVVPFRLTRDLVDAMGYTKTEGVFRRCCEFTLEALREERESIMTLLNVLRYDPLYNWSVSPLKAKRMQEAQDGERGPVLDEITVQASRKREDETGEAGRALAVVEKKLSKTLSVAATVSELIQQATDERNLALLFSGWAAYA